MRAYDVRVLGGSRDEVLLRFSVTDTGPGLSPAAQRRLFQPFQQADNSSTRRHGGTGLGLALTRELAGVLGGEVGVDSREGAGSTFWFTARLERPPADAQTPFTVTVVASQATSLESRLRMEHSGRRILVAEDNLVNQEVMSELLTSAGLVVALAHDGEQATRTAQEERFDAVLMDVQMPHVDGIEATRRMRARGFSAPIIAVTADAFAHEREACLAAGMNDHLGKPVAPEALYAALLRAPTPSGGEAEGMV